MSAPPDSATSSAKSARVAVTLGAAFALFCLAVFGLDTPTSMAAGGFFDMLFGGGPSYVSPAPNSGGYGAGAKHRHNGHYHRHARHGRRYQARYAYAHRQMVERRHASAAERRLWRQTDREGAASRRLSHQNERSGGAIETVSLAEMSAVTPAKTPQTQNRRTVCVRGCDGYFFPIANLARDSEIPSQQVTCEKLCPGAQASLFVMPAGSDKIDEAVATRGGESYAQLTARLNATDSKSQSCGCQASANTASRVSSALQSDFTLRPGDTVVTSQGVRVVRRGSHFPFKERDFVSLAETQDVPASNRRVLYAIDRVLKTPHGRLLTASSERRRAHHHDWRL